MRIIEDLCPPATL
jgi:hypothetical protein